MSDVFLSYARADHPRAEWMAAALRSLGFSVFWDRDIPAGSTWDRVLEEQLASVRCVLVLWSAHSVGSDWVKIEAAEANRVGKLLPVLLDDVPIPLEFRRVQTARLVGWAGDERDPGFTEVVSGISRLLDRPMPSPVPVPGKPAWLRRVLLVGGAALAIGAVAWLALRPGPGPDLRLVARDGSCPPGVAGTRLTAVLGGETTRGAISGDCRFRLPAHAAKADLRQVGLTLDPDAKFLIQTPADLRDSLRVFVVDKGRAPRGEIALLAYHGIGTDAARRAAFDVFRGALQDKITNLVQELSDNPELTGADAAQQLNRLRLQMLGWNGTAWVTADSGAMVGGDVAGLDREQQLRIWQERHSLSLLSGTLSGSRNGDSGPFRVDNQMFIGTLDGSANGRSIPLTMEIGPEEFRVTRDAHALAVLYALALDARHLGYPDEVVTAYLSKAYSIAQTLRGSATGGRAPDVVERIATRVDSELSDLAQRSRRP